MWSRAEHHGRRWGAALLVVAGAVGTAVQAAACPVCPTLPHDPVQQIDLFDGKPEEQAYLAPDREQGGVAVYDVAGLYTRGSWLTVRCRLRSGTVVDIPLTQRTARCTFQRDRQGTPLLRCP